MNRIIDILITEVSKKGNGQGPWVHPSGKNVIVEIPFTFPGDHVRAKVLKKSGKNYLGKLEEILKPSDKRIAPKCVHFGVCGGCRFQHIPYEEQLKHKENLVHTCFGSLLTEKVAVHPIVACPQPWHYRNKMEYSFSTDAANKKYLGLIIDSSKGRVLNLTECYLTNPWFIDALKSVRQWWQETDLDAYHIYKDSGSLRTLTLREGQRTGDRMVILTVSGNPDFALHKSQLESFVAFVRDAIEPPNPTSQLSIFLRIQQVAPGMSTSMYEMLLYGSDHIREILRIKLNPEDTPEEFTFNVSPSAFFQPNSQQAEKVYALALKLINPDKDAVVYDLYCGTGTMGICLSKYVKQVVGIEVSPESVLNARENADRNNCDNVTIISSAVRYMIEFLEENKIPLPDVVIVNPPRPGLDPNAMKHLMELKPKKILYVSCNPVTQSANITEIVSRGYELKAIQPVDHFPQTAHVENIALLEKVN